VLQRAAEYALETHREARYDPLRAIADRVRAGPLLLLRQLYYRTERVDVMLRGAHGVRGVMRATLHGFDKYLNMLLADVHEVFVARERVCREKPKWVVGADGAAVEDVQVRVSWRQELRQRRLARTVLKGDHVVLVHRAQGVLRLPGALGKRYNAQIEELCEAA